MYTMKFTGAGLAAVLFAVLGPARAVAPDAAESDLGVGHRLAGAAREGAGVDPALVRAVIDRLVRDGALDQAIDEGIDRYVEVLRARERATEEARRLEAHRKVQAVRRPDPARDHWYGDPGTRFVLVEYSDFECPFCRTFHASAAEFVTRHPGEVSWVFRHLPLDIHGPLALAQARASECVARLKGNEAFWIYADAIFATTGSNGDGMPMEALATIAQTRLGVDGGRVRDLSGRRRDRGPGGAGHRGCAGVGDRRDAGQPSHRHCERRGARRRRCGAVRRARRAAREAAIGARRSRAARTARQARIGGRWAGSGGATRRGSLRGVQGALAVRSAGTRRRAARPGPGPGRARC